MLIQNRFFSFVRPGSCEYLKPSQRSISVSHNKSGCSAVCNSVEGHHVQKQHIVHSHRVTFARVSDHLCKSLNERTTRHWLNRFHVNASTDGDFRSSRNTAISLFKRYKNVIDRGGGDNLKEFVKAGVNAYALGCTDEGLRKELMDIKNSGVEIEGLGTYGGTSLKFKIHSSEMKSTKSHCQDMRLDIRFVNAFCGSVLPSSQYCAHHNQQLSDGLLPHRCQLTSYISGRDFVLLSQMLTMSKEWHGETSTGLP